MFYLFKKKPKFSFVTHDEMVYNYFQVSEGKNFFPQWWRDIKHDLYATDIWPAGPTEKSVSTKLLTMKTCPGITDLYKNSYVMPLWSEVDILTTKTSVRAIASDKITKTDSHGSHQRGNFLDEKDYSHLKIQSPWMVETTSNIKFLVSSCMFSDKNLLDNYFIPNGVRSFNISSSTNIHGFVRKEENNFTLKAGVPLVHLFPLTDQEISIQCEFDPEKFNYLNKTQPDRFGFSNAYYIKKRLMNRKQNRK